MQNCESTPHQNATGSNEGQATARHHARIGAGKAPVGSSAECQRVCGLRWGVLLDGARLVSSAGLSRLPRIRVLAGFRPVAHAPKRLQEVRAPGEERRNLRHFKLAASGRANFARSLIIGESVFENGPVAIRVRLRASGSSLSFAVGSLRVPKPCGPNPASFSSPFQRCPRK